MNITKHLKILILVFFYLSFNNCEEQSIDFDYIISINESIDIEFETKRLTDYSWFWVNQESINFVENHVRSEFTDETGLKGIEIWNFVGTNTGEGKIILLYKRSSTDTKYESKKEFLIKVE
jgi:predicted secreted protein